MTYKEQAKTYFEDMGAQELRRNISAAAREIAEELGCSDQVVRDAAYEWLRARAKAKLRNDLESLEDYGPDDRYRVFLDWEREEYVCDFQGWPVFDVPFDVVQFVAESYVHKGGGLTQKSVLRLLADKYDRQFDLKLFQRFLRAIHLDKNSLPFAPHRRREEQPDVLADTWLAKEEAMIQRKYDAKQVSYYKRKFQEAHRKLMKVDSLIDRVVEAAEIEPATGFVVAEIPDSYEPVEPYDGILLLSDWHTGLAFQTDDIAFNWGILQERIHLLADNLIDHLKLYRRPLQHLTFAIAGDMIDGVFGDMHPGQWMHQDLHEDDQVIQAAGLMAMLVGSIGAALPASATCSVKAVVGNHGRGRKDRRDDPNRVLERLCYKIASMQTPLIPWEVGNHLRWRSFNTGVILTHGDRTPKDPKALGWMQAEDDVLILHGHSHRPAYDVAYSGGVTQIGNGSPVGSSDFERDQIGKKVRPSQTFVEVGPQGATIGREFRLDAIS